jgi:hypothetical protein
MPFWALIVLRTLPDDGHEAVSYLKPGSCWSRISYY